MLSYRGSIIAKYTLIRADTDNAAIVLTSATKGLVDGSSLTFEGQNYTVANITIDDVVCK